MSKGKKKSQKAPKPTATQRGLQIVVIIVSIMLALSMVLSAFNF